MSVTVPIHPDLRELWDAAYAGAPAQVIHHELGDLLIAFGFFITGLGLAGMYFVPSG